MAWVWQEDSSPRGRQLYKANGYTIYKQSLQVWRLLGPRGLSSTHLTLKIAQDAAEADQRAYDKSKGTGRAP